MTGGRSENRIPFVQFSITNRKTNSMMSKPFRGTIDYFVILRAAHLFGFRAIFFLAGDGGFLIMKMVV